MGGGGAPGPCEPAMRVCDALGLGPAPLGWVILTGSCVRWQNERGARTAESLVSGHGDVTYVRCALAARLRVSAGSVGFVVWSDGDADADAACVLYCICIVKLHVGRLMDR